MRLGCLTLVLLVTGCATGAPVGGGLGRVRYPFATPSASPRGIPGGGGGTARTLTRDPEARAKVVRAARGFIGKKRLVAKEERFADACNGLVEAAYAAAGARLEHAHAPGDNAVTSLFRFAQRQGRIFEKEAPEAGDLVFFRETYDQNRDGRRNDGLTHVGIVESVDAAGTVSVIHRVRRGVVRYRMNLARPDARRDAKSGAILNDYLRPPGRSAGKVLTGQLFVAYASLLPASPAQALASR